RHCLLRGYVMSSNSGLHRRRCSSPPHPSWTPCSVPSPGGCTVHFRGHVIVLCNLLLNGQVPVTLILLFAANVGETSFLIFINVKDSFSRHSRPLDLVGRQGSIDLLLRWRLRRARAEPSRSEQGCSVA